MNLETSEVVPAVSTPAISAAPIGEASASTTKPAVILTVSHTTVPKWTVALLVEIEVKDGKIVRHQPVAGKKMGVLGIYTPEGQLLKPGGDHLEDFAFGMGYRNHRLDADEFNTLRLNYVDAAHKLSTALYKQYLDRQMALKTKSAEKSQPTVVEAPPPAAAPVDETPSRQIKFSFPWFCDLHGIGEPNLSKTFSRTSAVGLNCSECHDTEAGKHVHDLVPTQKKDAETMINRIQLAKVWFDQKKDQYADVPPWVNSTLDKWTRAWTAVGYKLQQQFGALKVGGKGASAQQIKKKKDRADLDRQRRNSKGNSKGKK